MAKGKDFRPPLGRDFYPDDGGTGAERWLKRLRETGEVGLLALDALNRLSTAGCDRGFLVWLLMQLHSTQRWNPVSRKAAQQALEQTRRLEPSLRLLAHNSLREELALDNGLPSASPGWSLVGELEAFRERLEVAVAHATERENQLFNEMMSQIVTHVLEKTGAFHDGDLSAIVTPIVGRPFSAEGWRKRHLRGVQRPTSPAKRPKKQVQRVLSKRSP